MERKVVGQLTKEEIEAFRKNSVCTTACSKLVKEVVYHFELAEMEKFELWEAVHEKYKLDRKLDWNVDRLNGEIYEESKSGTLMKKGIDQFETRNWFKKSVRKIFGLEK